jgi:predicted NAD/FAD-binding protein
MAVDTGFIVFNPQHYPLLTALFDELGVASQPTTMSFDAQRAQRRGVQRHLAGWPVLPAPQPGLAALLGHAGRPAPVLSGCALAAGRTEGPTLGEYLRSQRYGEAFIEEHLLPMASALWSSPAATVRDFPARYLAQFMANHQMLQMTGRPSWRVVSGGSARYVDALRRRWRVHERLQCPVTRSSACPGAHACTAPPAWRPSTR